jgi:streptogramin lyase
MVVGAIVAAAVAATAIPWLLFRGDERTAPPEVTTPTRSLVELDPETGGVRQRIVFERPGRPERGPVGRAMIAGQGAVWVGQPTDFREAMFHVDPRHGEVRHLIVAGSGFSFSLESAFDALWVATDRLVRINPATEEQRVVLRIPLPPSSDLARTSFAADRDHLWIGTSQGILIRIDPSGRVTDRRRVGDSIDLVAAGEEGVWAVDQLAGLVTRLDPGSLETTAEIKITGAIDAIEVMGEYVWTLDFGTGALSRIAVLTDRVVGQGSVPQGPTALAVGLGAIWVSHSETERSRRSTQRRSRHPSSPTCPDRLARSPSTRRGRASGST